MDPPKYFLSPGVFLCATDLHWIVLDVNRDKYLAIHKRHFEPLGPLLHGWSVTDATPQCIEDPQEPGNASELASELLKLGLLTTDSQCGKSARKPAFIKATRVMSPHRLSENKVLRSLCAPMFLLASAKADYLLRHSQFARIVRLVQMQRGRLAQRHSTVDFQRTESLVSVFNSLRPIYPRNYLCMFDSLALIQFLASFRMFPNWVFGVTADPFLAHCWVQQDDVILNDTFDRTTGYNPIMWV